MKIPQPQRLAVLLAVLALTSACTESYTLKSTWQSSGVPTVSLAIDNIEGNVRLTRGAPGSTVSGTLRVIASGFDKEAQARDAAQRVQILERIQDGAMQLDVAIPQEHRKKTFNVALDLSVPAGVEVSVMTDNGRVSVSSLPVDEIDTTYGGIDLQFTSAIPGRTTVLKTNNGTVTVDSHDGPLDAATSNGDMRLYAVNGSTRGTTTNGYIDARIFPEERGDIFLATSNADVTLAVAPGFGAQVVAVTTAPGVFSVGNLPFTPTGPGDGVLGNGRGRIDLRTTAGNIYLTR